MIIAYYMPGTLLSSTCVMSLCITINLLGRSSPLPFCKEKAQTFKAILMSHI